MTRLLINITLSFLGNVLIGDTMYKIIVCLVSFMMVGCTDARLKQYATIGDPAKITCYSGGKIIYEGTSTGKVHSEETSDGWYFVDSDTNKLIRVSGDCLIVN